MAPRLRGEDGRKVAVLVYNPFNNGMEYAICNNELLSSCRWAVTVMCIR